MQGKVMTVTGPVQGDSLGVTLPHEHLLVDTSVYWHQPTPNDPVTERKVAYMPVTIELLGMIRRRYASLVLDNHFLDDVNLATAEIMEFGNAGGNTLVELSNRGLGRDHFGLQAIARRSGINIVSGTGYYTKPSHPAYLASKSVAELAQIMIRDIVEGIDGSQVRCGIIGEIGLSPKIDPDEEKVLRAACLAQRKTGTALTIHYISHLNADEGGSEAMRIVDIVEQEGCDPSRTILGHQDCMAVDGLFDVEPMKQLLRRKAYVEFDNFGHEELVFHEGLLYQAAHDYHRIQTLKKLVEAGFLSQLLVSHDVCRKSHLKRYGGFGYDHVPRTLLPVFNKMGITAGDVDKLMAENPTRVLPVSSL